MALGWNNAADVWAQERQRQAEQEAQAAQQQQWMQPPVPPAMREMLPQGGVGPDVGRALLAALQQMGPVSGRGRVPQAIMRGFAQGFGQAQVGKDERAAAENAARMKANEAAQGSYDAEMRARRQAMLEAGLGKWDRAQPKVDKEAELITEDEAKKMGHPEFAGMRREDVRLRLNARDAKSGEVTPATRFGALNTLTDNARQDMKSWGNVRDGYRRLVVAEKVGSGPGDLALIFSYMKILDPDSTIMPSEYKNAAEAVGLDQRLRNVPEWVVKGDKLTPEGRKWFVEAGKALYSARLSDAQETLAMYREQAKYYGIDPRLAIGRFEAMIARDAEGSAKPVEEKPSVVYPTAGRRVR